MKDRHSEHERLAPEFADSLGLSQSCSPLELESPLPLVTARPLTRAGGSLDLDVMSSQRAARTGGKARPRRGRPPTGLWSVDGARGVRQGYLYVRHAAALLSLLFGELVCVCSKAFFSPTPVSMSVTLGALFCFQVEICEDGWTGSQRIVEDSNSTCCIAMDNCIMLTTCTMKF